ncbi:isoaspartyl peptidase/L-asparaginase [Babesia caballi]|uniref:Isoaspartyl peptidase/L-asparaginase n=1 Tax=Babesia caballi TaxID=5871 RepID=A0AAV4LUX4_BABCB|nr:isoaspartyl peptidase/L-asparaginase [Babesia caballi]
MEPKEKENPSEPVPLKPVASETDAAPAAAEPAVESAQESKRGYAVLDLHLNQFLSFIAEDYSFLPCAIYNPRIDVHLDGKLVYKSRVLSHEDDVFGNLVRLRICSPNSVVTLKLYECVQLRLTEKCVDELIQPTLKKESMEEVLISWCNLEVGLLVPAQKYEVVCAFRVNPMFLHYNPGGILYYPTVKGKAFIDNKRVCCACRVCVFLASNTLTVHNKVLTKYFDFRCDPHQLEIPRRPVAENTQSSTEACGLEAGGRGAVAKEGAADESGGSQKAAGEPTVRMIKEKDYLKEAPVDEVPHDSRKVETLEMNVKKVFFTKEGCTCCRLVEVPRTLRGVNYTPCACCHDYQVCCEHSVENYYYASVSLKLVSKTPIDFKTELCALMNNPVKAREEPNAESDSLCSIVTRAYELYAAFGLCNRHLGVPSGQVSPQKYVWMFVALILAGFIFDGKTLTVSCFLLGFFTMYLRTASLKQHERDFGDVIEASRRLTLSGQGIEKVIRDMVEAEESNTVAETENRFQRNMKCVRQQEFVDDVKIFSKLNTSLQRSENISIKTLTQGLSSSVPKQLRGTLVRTLDMCESLLWYLNALLAVVRRYGIAISVFFCGMGVLSLGYAFWMKCVLKALLLIVVTSALMEDHPAVRRRFGQLQQLLRYLTMRVYRREWFLNANSFP